MVAKPSLASHQAGDRSDSVPTKLAGNAERYINFGISGAGGAIRDRGFPRALENVDVQAVPVPTRRSTKQTAAGGWISAIDDAVFNRPAN
jgi:hypothetical protein